MAKKLLLSCMACSILLSSCATSANPNDPYEAYNRQVFKANMAMDSYVLRPVTVAYTYVPDPIRDALNNFYTNLRDFVSLANDILQLDGINTMHTFMRISINSTFGILGLIDVAGSMGLPEYKNTFGNTMKTWGWEDSSYFLIPFLGPGTLRDQIGIAPDVFFNPMFWIIKDNYISFSIFGLDLIEKRAQYLGQDELLEQSLDPYVTIRDLYLKQKGYYKYPSESDSEEESSEDTEFSVDDMIKQENESSGTIKLKTVPIKNNADTQIDQLIDEENVVD